jgi:outer membrane protein assembly factor BamD
MLKIFQNLFFAIICFTSLTGVGIFSKKPEVKLNKEVIYKEGIEFLKEAEYRKASKAFAKIYYLDPYSELARKSQLLESYSYFMDGKYEDTSIVAETFTKLHPLDVNAEFIQYMNCLSHYTQINPVYLDQSFTQVTKTLFEDFIINYPTSKFISAARYKLLVITEHLAAKEMDVGRYYLFRNDPMPAILRFKKVLHEYDGTNQVPEALHRLTESFAMLGLYNEAIKYATILGYNFPESKWYESSYKLIKNHQSK